jgi:heme A synthase
VGLHLLHRANAYGLLVWLAAAAWAARSDAPLGRLAALGLAVAACEVAVGVANVLTGIPPEITGLHSLGATLLILTWALVVREVVRRPAAPA